MKRVKEKPGATLAGATGQEDDGAHYALTRRLQGIVRQFAHQIVLALEAFCSRIETKHELKKWNRVLERDG